METYTKNTTTTALEIEELYVKDTSSTADEIVELYRYNGSTADLVFEKASTGSSLLQEMTWTMTATATATISSTGTEVVNPNNTTQLEVNGGPRFWNGSEALNAGAILDPSSRYRFATGALCQTWWTSNYQARARQNGRDWMVMDGPTPGTIFTNTAATYNNVGNVGTGYWNASGDWIPMASGQTIDFEIYTKGTIPDNWSTDAVGINIFTGFGTTGFSGYMQSGTSGAVEEVRVQESPYFGAMRCRARTVDGVYGVQLLPNPGSSGPFAPYAAMWWTREGSTTTSDWYVLKYESTASQGAFYSFVESRDGATSLPASNNLKGPLAVARYTSSPTNLANWPDPYGSVLEWDALDNELIVAADSQNGTSVQVVPSYDSNPGVLDPYAQDGTSSVEIDLMGWASATSLKLFMSATVNTTTFTAGLPYAAHWMEQEGRWRKLEAADRGPSKSDMRYTFTSGDYPNYLFNNMGQPDQAILFFESDPGDVSKWRPYDGPTS
ncbi:MAG: hypothetical protein GY871_16865 [Actinomycetales bacterium]|nr:hypothetical protein [Actinomycetales bacterium]